MKIASSAALLLAVKASIIAAQEELPYTTSDVFIQSGEVSASSININARCNSEEDSKIVLFVNDVMKQEAQVTSEDDFTITFEVDGLESNTDYSYVVTCDPLGEDAAVVATPKAASDATYVSMDGSFKTAPAADDEVAVNFVWAADLAGQGWGRNPDFELVNVAGETIKGGYIVFDTMSSLNPDFALFQGDMIYADNSISPVKAIPEAMGGGNWTNNPSKDFIAVTLDEFRANWKYNFGDEKMQDFLADVPVFVQWDDHEVTNNWYPGEILGGPLYEEGTEADLLYRNSLQAFYEFNPIQEGEKIYRSQRFGKHLEIFFPDYRSYRDPNPGNSDPEGIDMMGPEQVEWLKNGLSESTATWKIISSHDPLGIVTGGDGDRDGFGQEDPALLGREVEVKEVLSHIHDNGITGVVSVTSDVHFTSHVSMHPDRAEGGFTAFTPLEEFCIGPIHAGSFGPNFMDSTFGAIYEYEMGPLTLGYERWANLPPSEIRLQSFGHAAVSEDGVLSIKLIGINGETKWEKTLEPPAVEETSDESKESSATSMVVNTFAALVAAFGMVL